MSDADHGGKCHLEHWPDSNTLDRACLPVEEFHPGQQDVADTLVEEARAHRGVGFAAPQLGMLWRICVVRDGGCWVAMANPELASHGREQVVAAEGCLSLPGVWLPIRRWAVVTVRYRTPTEGLERRRTFKREQARAAQHELDHLDGVLIRRRAEAQRLEAA